ncbi:uncharacterized protein LOC108216459 [Daucus carota subsp. sativus]|uniref:uncharacterized protein LOC108216459 n=1 Tax=Daucus carota subsp. sativus TaxID=79200 RepID=UPI0007EF447B|nr:PREDICTED: uncharacterized protein LOC108218120 [Daucus carota subsp. sativus]
MYSSSSSENTPSRSDRSCVPGTLVEVPVLYDTSYKPETLFDVPVFYQFDSDSEEPEAVSEVDLESSQRQRQQKSERVELSERFNFVLPKDFVPLVDDEDIQMLSVEDKTRLPLPQRLKGWIREIRRRSSGRLDIFYYHEKSGEKPYRSFRDVKRFIYLGFFPSAENKNSYLERWALDQPNPREEGTASALSAPNTNLQVQICSSPVPDNNVQIQDEGKQQEKRPRLRTEIVELSEPFNFLLPTDYVSLVDDDDEEIQKLSNGDVMWLPLAQRLKGWVRETRCRANGRLDFFYYHKGSGEKQYRSFRDVKRYIYLGFFPSAENGNKYLDQWVFDQPNPREEGVTSASAASNSTSTTQIQEESFPFDMSQHY